MGRRQNGGAEPECWGLGQSFPAETGLPAPHTLTLTVHLLAANFLSSSTWVRPFYPQNYPIKAGAIKGSVLPNVETEACSS